MRVSMEIFSIPEESMETLRRAIYDSYERFLHGKEPGESDMILSLRGGTCPLSEKKYMHLDIQTSQSIDLRGLNLFTDSLFAAHPLRNDEIVRTNLHVKLEDSAGVPDADSLPAGIDEEALSGGEMSCWICGRFEGEEYEDFLTNDSLATEVHMAPDIQVPLCVVCARILHRSSSIE